jgi:AraC-like DNA-binding protein/quercetin dioxygenase-like cupin family protein
MSESNRVGQTNSPSLHATHTITQADVALSARRPVRAHRLTLPAGSVVEPHDHEYFEVGFILSGSVVQHTRQGETRLGAGQVACLGPGQVHAFDILRCTTFVNLYYLSEWLLADPRMLWREPGVAPLFLEPALFSPLEASPVAVLTLSTQARVRCLQELDVLKEEEDTSEPSTLFLLGALLKVLALLGRSFATAHPTRDAVYRREVWYCLEEIENCLAAGETFRVAQTATALGLSPDHLGRLFQRATGHSLNRYYQNRRIQRAQNLLLDPRHSITEVALATGFSDASHLSHQFRSRVGITPRQYRTTYLQDRTE